MGFNEDLATLFTVSHETLIRETFSSADDCVRKLDECSEQSSPQTHFLFLNGYPTPEWIASIGSYCHVDPAFFSSHLWFRCRREYFSSPPPPSSGENIITLRFVTIGSREKNRGGSDQESVDKLRLDNVSSMHKYQHELMVGSRFEPGDSVVRDCSILDEKHFIIEQNLSICLNKVGKDSVGEVTRGSKHIFANSQYSVDLYRCGQRSQQRSSRSLAN